MKQIIVSVILAVIGSFIIHPLSERFWQTSFTSKTIAGPYIWSFNPTKPGSLNVVFWLTFANQGDIAGSIDRLELQISLPKETWFLSPVFTVEGRDYWRMFYEQKYDVPSISEPFVPIYLPAHSQSTRAVLFKEFYRELNPANLAPGNHKIILYARPTGGRLEQVWTGLFSVSDDEFRQWKAGNTLRRLQVPTEKPTWEAIAKP